MKLKIPDLAQTLTSWKGGGLTGACFPAEAHRPPHKHGRRWSWRVPQLRSRLATLLRHGRHGTAAVQRGVRAAAVNGHHRDSTRWSRAQANAVRDSGERVLGGAKLLLS